MFWIDNNEYLYALSGWLHNSRSDFCVLWCFKNRNLHAEQLTCSLFCFCIWTRKSFIYFYTCCCISQDGRINVFKLKIFNSQSHNLRKFVVSGTRTMVVFCHLWDCNRLNFASYFSHITYYVYFVDRYAVICFGYS